MFKSQFILPPCAKGRMMDCDGFKKGLIQIQDRKKNSEPVHDLIKYDFIANGIDVDRKNLSKLAARFSGIWMNPLHRLFDQRRMARYSWVLLSLLLFCSCFSGEGLEPGDKAPSFELETLDGEPFRFDPPFKRTQVIYFWSVWCRYCEDDFQQLNKLFAKWEKEIDSPRLVAINAGQPEKRIRKFLKKMNPSFPIYLDRDIKLAHRFGVRGLPTYFITDKQGIIRHMILGWADEKTLLGKIDKVD